MKELELEYMFHTSPGILFPQLSSSSGLTGWFADKVRQEGEIYYFSWAGFERSAHQIDVVDRKRVRFNWMDEMGYFQFKIEFDEISDQTILFVNETMDEEELDSAKNLWDFQIAHLKHMIGC